MIWLVKECYGHYYEDSWDNTLGYYTNETDAEKLKDTLNAKYKYYDEHKEELSSLEQELRDNIDDYDILDEEVEKLEELFGYQSNYSYDWYDVKVEKVESLS
jgi:DNA repair ATPase RecN